ncbi:MAG: redox-regulated ATPase YchF [Candidatus Pacebacteria bacterium]|nr:redox-regulated ATPase YchF [Candidatus Paceibacterota bacterium]
MKLSVAIVGLPNVGKSTLFNALLKKQLAVAANYPFATIEPNVGIVAVPDDRLQQLAEVVQQSQHLEQLPPIKPATVEFVDVAGLVKGANQGQGLGNQFLAHIRETSAVCHVLRAFSDENVIREGSVNPAEDLQTIRTELQLADLNTLNKQTQPKGAISKAAKQRWQLIEDFKNHLEAGQDLPLVDATAQALAQELCLLTAKPELVVINLDEAKAGKGNSAELIKKYADQLKLNPQQIILISAKLESELAVLAAVEQQQYLQELGLVKTGLERLAAQAYQTLKLQSFFTAGIKEVRAWTIKQGSTALEAAGVIHSDFMKHFVKARVISVVDFVRLGGWQAAKEQGKLRLEGRDYLLQPADVVEFMISN